MQGGRGGWEGGAGGSLPRPTRGGQTPPGDGGGAYPPPQQGSGASHSTLGSGSAGSGGPTSFGPGGGGGPASSPAGQGSVRSGVPGIYAGMIESIQLLALDPSPRVRNPSTLAPVTLFVPGPLLLPLLFIGVCKTTGLLAFGLQVAKLGRQVLKHASCELSFVPGMPGAPLAGEGFRARNHAQSRPLRAKP